MKRVLVLHGCGINARKVTVDHMSCVPKQPGDNLYVLHHILAPVTDALRRFRFDGVVINYCFLSHRTGPLLDELRRTYAFLANMDAVTIALPQDDYTCSALLDEWLTEMKVSLILSPIDQGLEALYPQATAAGVPIRHAFTGYVNSDETAMLTAFRRPWAERGRDIGTRVRMMAPHYGRFGSIKGRMAERFRDLAVEAGFAVDISTNPADVFLGDDWIRFMGDCKFTISMKGGASLADPRGQIKHAVQAYLARRPGASFEEIEAACFPGLDMRYVFSAVSPRLFEAAALDVCQILTRADYPGGLEPHVDYIPVEQDFSDAATVFEIMRDEARCHDMALSCRRKLVDSGIFEYRTFAEEILGEIPSSPPPDAAELENLDAHFRQLDPFTRLMEVDGGMLNFALRRNLQLNAKVGQLGLLRRLCEFGPNDYRSGGRALLAGDWPASHPHLVAAFAELCRLSRAADPAFIDCIAAILDGVIDGRYPGTSLNSWDICELIRPYAA